jgi:RNA polymerase sigma-70 factor (ECF subfamily)
MANISEKFDANELDFNAIVQETQSHLRAYIAGMGVSRHDVDDIAQDVYVELYRCLDRVPREVTIKQWLKGIARNLCMNYFRRNSRRGRLHREALAEMLADLTREESSDWYAGSMEQALQTCVEKLPKESRRMVKLRYAEEMPSQTIAEKLNSTAEAIRIALFRIRAALKNCVVQRMALEGT